MRAVALHAELSYIAVELASLTHVQLRRWYTCVPMQDAVVSVLFGETESKVKKRINVCGRLDFAV